MNAQKSPFKLHLSIRIDIHIDEHYLEKSDPENYCHRKNTDNSKNTAGKFGALGSDCDSPVTLV
jgi:hypothetical protein